jgi:hypothetical protein
MKAVLALIGIYIAAFIIATQGSSQNPVQASAPGSEIAVTINLKDSGKVADLRSLLESVGAREQLQAVASESAVQYREKLRGTGTEIVKEGERRAMVNSATETFQKNFDQQHALQQIAGIYDKHYSDEEIRGLLDFFSSPLGKKFAAESPKVAREIAAVQAAAAANATRDSLLGLDARNSNSAPEKSVGVGSNSTKSKGMAVEKDQLKEISTRP